MRLCLISTIALLTAFPASAAGPELEDLELLDQRIAVFLGGSAQDAGLRAEPIDRRLRLSRCVDAAEFAQPQDGTLFAECPSKGWRVRILLKGTTPARTDAVVIRRGDAVDLAYRGDGFSVSTQATAIEDGRMGGRVRVKSPTSPAVLTTLVKAPGSVAIDD